MNDELLIFSGNPKAGSTWLGGLFSGIAIELGMKFFYGQYAILKNQERIKNNKFDMVISQSSNYNCMQELNLPYKCIHVIRDPRDVLVSSYFSFKETHNTDGWPALKNLRKQLNCLSFEDGMLETMRFNKYFFDTLRDWNYDDKNVMELKYEDLIRSLDFFINAIFNFLGLCDNTQNNIAFNVKAFYNRVLFRSNILYDNLRVPQQKMPTRRISSINQKLSFSKLSKGRNQGDENTSSHYRKGIGGDWKVKFSERIKKAFKDEYGDLLIQLDYESDYSW